MAGVYADTIMRFIALRLTPPSTKNAGGKPTNNGNIGGDGTTEMSGLEDAFDERTFQKPGDFRDVINLPVPLEDGFVKGIDISHHNRIISWPEVRKVGIEFVYIKITDGVATPDTMADTHAREARQQGLKIGYYHFCRPDRKIGGTVDSDARAEAKEVTDTLKGLPKADLPLMIDLEDQDNRWDTPLNPGDYLTWTTVFLDNVFTGTDPLSFPIIYSRKEYLDRKLPGSHSLTTRLWLSRYNPDSTQAISANGWPDWTIWQFTDAGQIGPNGPLDLDIWRKDDYLSTLAVTT